MKGGWWFEAESNAFYGQRYMHAPKLVLQFTFRYELSPISVWNKEFMPPPLFLGYKMQVNI